MKTTTKQRHGDTMIAVQVETTPAVIQFADILAACEIEPDYEYNPFDCDGFEHTLHSYRIGDGWNLPDEANDKEMRGSGWIDGGGNSSSGYAVVTIDRDHARRERWGSPGKGASKQVRAEMIAQNIGTTIDYIRKMYAEGCGYGVTCTYLDAHSSCWGYDSYEYAESQQQEHAQEVADQLQQWGYTVEGLPQPEKRFRNGYTRSGWTEKVRSQLQADCWKELKYGNRSYRKHRARLNYEHAKDVQRRAAAGEIKLRVPGLQWPGMQEVSA